MGMGQLIDTGGPCVSLWAGGVKGGLMPRPKSTFYMCILFGSI